MTLLFLASDDASYITGVELNVDGGRGQLYAVRQLLKEGHTVRGLARR